MRVCCVLSPMSGGIRKRCLQKKWYGLELYVLIWEIKRHTHHRINLQSSTVHWVLIPSSMEWGGLDSIWSVLWTPLKENVPIYCSNIKRIIKFLIVFSLLWILAWNLFLAGSYPWHKIVASSLSFFPHPAHPINHWVLLAPPPEYILNLPINLHIHSQHLSSQSHHPLTGLLTSILASLWSILHTAVRENFYKHT